MRLPFSIIRCFLESKSQAFLLMTYYSVYYVRPISNNYLFASLEIGNLIDKAIKHIGINRIVSLPF